MRRMAGTSYELSPNKFADINTIDCVLHPGCLLQIIGISIPLRWGCYIRFANARKGAFCQSAGDLLVQLARSFASTPAQPAQRGGESGPAIRPLIAARASRAGCCPCGSRCRSVFGCGYRASARTAASRPSRPRSVALVCGKHYWSWDVSFRCQSRPLLLGCSANWDGSLGRAHCARRKPQGKSACGLGTRCREGRGAVEKSRVCELSVTRRQSPGIAIGLGTQMVLSRGG